jgi:hypothetical protein
MIKLHGFEGGKELGFTGEGGGRLGEEDDVLACGPHAGARSARVQRTCAGGERLRQGRGVGRAAGPGGEEGRGGLGREGGGGSGPGKEGGLWARLGPKEEGGLFLGFSF